MRRMLTVLVAVSPLLLASGVGWAAYKNLSVLPNDISKADLDATMKRMTRALGVKCTHCHVSKKDFAGDGNKKKSTARDMIRMTVGINRDYFGYIGAPVVTCMTCHKGRTKPAVRR